MFYCLSYYVSSQNNLQCCTQRFSRSSEFIYNVYRNDTLRKIISFVIHEEFLANINIKAIVVKYQVFFQLAFIVAKKTKNFSDISWKNED